MNRLQRTAILVVLVCISLLSDNVHAQSAREVAKKVLSPVVLLVMQDAKGQPVSLGSGFFVRADVVATNLHVIAGSGGGSAKIVGRRSSLGVAGLVGIEARRDLALLKLTGANAPALKVGDDSKMAVGDEVFVAGNPEGLEGTLSQGIVSGIRRVEGDRLLQITAPISPDSSGGPVLNAAGEVIGVAVATYREGQNLNFAVPSGYLRSLLADMKPLTALTETTASRNRPSITSSAGALSEDAVVAVNFRWSREDLKELPYYVFTLRNKLREPVTSISYVIIFYGDNDEPIHSELGVYGGPILGSLAKTVESLDVTGSNKYRYAPQISREVLKVTNRVEIRVLDFQMMRESGLGNRECCSAALKPLTMSVNET